jgi:hypothetical protein
MLRRLLARLQHTLSPLREWLKILLMDRGYWGTDLFCELKQDYGIDFVSRVRDQRLEINGSIQRQLEEADRRWTTLQEQRQFSGRRETQNVRLTALRPITLISDETAAHRQIAVHVVVAHQSHLDGSPIRDKNGKDISRTDYVTSLPPGMYGVKVRGSASDAGGSRIRVFVGCRRPGISTVRRGTATERCWRGWYSYS